ncbi:MAG: hypothetical protein ACIAQZ_05085 [Sedimentisphaeraceae bacterium JB056]
MKFSAKCFLLLLFCPVLFGADTASDTQKNDDSDSKKTAVVADDHQSWEEGRVHVEGTHVSIVPPEGFEVTDGFKGFVMREKTASIVVIEMTESYSKFVEEFKKESLENRSFHLISQQNVKIDGKEALLFKLEQEIDEIVYNKHVLIYGTETIISMVCAIYPAKYEGSFSELMKESILTVRYYELSEEEAEQSISFSIREYDDFKVVSEMSDTIAYSINGEAAEASDEPVFLASKSLSIDISLTLDDRKPFAIKRLKLLKHLDNIVVISSSPITVDGLSGYKIMAKGKSIDDSLPISVYFVMLFDDDCYYAMVGEVGSSLRGKYFPSFKRMIRSFKVKSDETSSQRSGRR